MKAGFMLSFRCRCCDTRSGGMPLTVLPPIVNNTININFKKYHPGRNEVKFKDFRVTPVSGLHFSLMKMKTYLNFHFAL